MRRRLAERHGRIGAVDLDGDLFVRAFVTVLVVMDPIGNVPVFLALTRRFDAGARNRAALVGSLVAGGIIVGFALAGRQVLELLGISLEALQVAGGLLLLYVALELLRGGSGEWGPPVADDGVDHPVAMVPLGTPLLAGPGAIAATMVFVGEAGDTAGVVVVLAALVCVVVVIYVALRFSGLIARALRDNGILLLTRVMGLLVAAIAVQLIAEAVQVWVDDGVT